jgi:transposase
MLKITLNADQQKQLEDLVHDSPTPRIRQRSQALLFSHKGYKRAQIAQLFAVKVDTITAWFRRWQQDQSVNQLADAPRSGRKPKLHPEQKKT